MKLASKELEKNIEELFKEGKYEKIISSLDDSILEEYNDANLYAWIARAFGRLKKVDLNYKYAQKAIEINPMSPLGYLARGNAKANQEEYDDAIMDFDIALSLDQNYSDALASKGYALYFLKKYEIAIEYFKSALKLAPSDSETYSKLGNCFRQLKQYDMAIKAYNKAISLNKNDSSIFINRGITWDYKKEYNKAIKDYNHSILLKKNPIAYNNIGTSWSRKKQFQKAIGFYTEAISLDKNYANAYSNRALVYIKLRKYNEAIRDYEKLLQFTEISFANTNPVVILDNIQELKKKIENSWYEEVDYSVNSVKKILLFKKSYLTHFTGLSATKAMILDNSKFRLSEGNFLNDTSEGREFLDFVSFSTAKSFTKNSISTIYIERPFIGSFVAENKHDDLTLWRMYGKEDQYEAMGCALTLNREFLIKKLEEEFDTVDEESSAQQETQFTFYNVAYRENEIFKFSDSTAAQLKKLNSALQTLKHQIEKLNEDQKLSVSKLLNDIAYLFKSADYQYENEVRLVISGIGFKKEILKDLIPPRVFIELINIVPVLHRITLGPKVDRPDEWAAAFNYKIVNDMPFSNTKVEIVISHLPFK